MKEHLEPGSVVAWVRSTRRGRMAVIGFVDRITPNEIVVKVAYAASTYGHEPPPGTEFKFDRESGDKLLVSPFDEDILSLRYRALAKPAIREMRRSVKDYKGFTGAEDALAELDRVVEKVNVARAAIWLLKVRADADHRGPLRAGEGQAEGGVRASVP